MLITRGDSDFQTFQLVVGCCMAGVGIMDNGGNQAKTGWLPVIRSCVETATTTTTSTTLYIVHTTHYWYGMNNPRSSISVALDRDKYFFLASPLSLVSKVTWWCQMPGDDRNVWRCRLVVVCYPSVAALSCPHLCSHRGREGGGRVTPAQCWPTTTTITTAALDGSRGDSVRDVRLRHSDRYSPHRGSGGSQWRRLENGGRCPGKNHQESLRGFWAKGQWRQQFLVSVSSQLSGLDVWVRRGEHRGGRDRGSEEDLAEEKILPLSAARYWEGPRGGTSARVPEGEKDWMLNMQIQLTIFFCMLNCNILPWDGHREGSI